MIVSINLITMQCNHFSDVTRTLEKKRKNVKTDIYAINKLEVSKKYFKNT